jgi:hypothetical protein
MLRKLLLSAGLSLSLLLPAAAAVRAAEADAGGCRPHHHCFWKVEYRRACHECWHCAGVYPCPEAAEREACFLRCCGYSVLVVRL